MNKEIETNVEVFKAWKDGYYEGDPLKPLSHSTYGQFGFMSVLHATYLRCIKPYIREDTRALEIGPGRGAWTRCMLDAKEIWVMDAMSAEFNKFFEYVGNKDKVSYLHVEDFSCSDLPELHFDYMFSFGCLCHVSFDGISEYARNLFGKLRSGAECFWMIADFDKYNVVMENYQRYSVIERHMPNPDKYPKLYQGLRNFYGDNKPKKRAANDGHTPAPGTWYHAGTDRPCDMLTGLGYHVIDKDVGTCLRDPIIYFKKP